MKLPSALTSFIYKCDFFSTKVGFRFKEERQYASLTGGIVSILMILLFIGIFTNTGINLMNKEYIVASQNKKIFEDPSYLSLSKNQNFYFMTGLSGIDMNKDIRYFDISMTFCTYNTTLNATKKIKNKVPLIPCKKQTWASFQNRSIISSVGAFDVQKWLCPPQDANFQLMGKYTSQLFQFIKFSVQKCNSSLDLTRRCATNDQLNLYLQKNEVFTLNYYFINTILNPEQKDYLKYYLEDKNYFTFSLTQGLNANLYVSDYNVKTDQSLLPLQQIQQNKGGIVKENAQIFPYYVTGTQYAKFFLRKSNEQLIYTRSFRKIDDTLSYIGGLFSSLITCLMIVCFYNELSYELEIAKNIYRYDKNTLLDTNGFHFLNYIVYLFYFVLKLFGLKPKWEKMQHYDKSLIEVRKQMDVRLIFKKILFTQKLAAALLTPEQLTALHLQDKITISTAQEIRQNYFLPKLLVQQIEDKKRSSKNHFNNRLQTQNNDEEITSKAFSNEISHGEAKQNIQEISKDTFMIKQQLSFEENNSNLSQYNVNKDKITNSISAISFKGKTSKIYLKLSEIINKLVTQQAKGDQISRKILKGISPQIKQLLDVQSSQKNSEQDRKISIIDILHVGPLSSQYVHRPICQKKCRTLTADQIIQEPQQDENNFYKKVGRKKSLQNLKLKKSMKNLKIKQIKDIIVVQDFPKD